MLKDTEASNSLYVLLVQTNLGGLVSSVGNIQSSAAARLAKFKILGQGS